MKKRSRRKKGLAVILTAAMVVGLLPGVGTLQVSATGSTSTGDGVQTTLDVSKGNITITDDSVSGYDSAGTEVTTIDPDGYIITGTTTSKTVTVSGTQNITLDGVKIDLSGTGNYYANETGNAAFKIEDDSTGNITITIADDSENTLKSGYRCAGLQKNGSGDGIGKLTIKGGETGTGKLTATGGKFGAGIGGGDRGAGSSIEISGGTVTATGGECGAGIGGGYYGAGTNIEISGGTVTATSDRDGAGIGGGSSGAGTNIKISGGTVTATGGGGGGGAGIGGGYDGAGTNIEISGGSVKALAGFRANDIGGGYGNEACIPTNESNAVYLLLIPNPDSDAVRIDGISHTPVNHKAVDSEDGNLYVYLTGANHNITVGEKNYQCQFDNERNILSLPLEIKATNSSETLAPETDYTYINGVLTINTEKAVTISGATTTDTVVVKNGISTNITLNGVYIDVSGTGNAGSGEAGDAAFKIEDDSTENVTITLADGTTNVLKGGALCAGLQKNGSEDNIGKLTIQGGTTGTGKLIATGGFYGAGIGGGYRGSGANIEISGGTVTANGGFYGAGIGGGTSGAGSNIKISGGTVIATGGGGGAGIGGGYYGSGANIEISGGTVTANGGEGTFDYVYKGAGIGGGHNSDGSDIKITGGSVKVTAGSDANPIGGGYSKDPVTPTSDGTTSVYLLTIANPDGAEVFIDNSTTSYKPSNHSAADADDTNLYVYFTGENHTVAIGTGETAVTTEYKFYTDKFLPVPKASDFDFTKPFDLAYTGKAKTATVEPKSGLTGIGKITAVKYYNSDDTEVSDDEDFVPGTYTVKIDVAKGDNYAEVTGVKVGTFTITAGDLSRSGTGVASGTYGDTLGELTIDGMFVDFNGTTVAGKWEIKSSDTQDADYVPSVGDKNTYIATFTPSVNPSWYNTLTAEVTLEIKQATPAYEVPTNLTANCGDKLSSVKLPSGFEWTDNTTDVLEAGFTEDGQTVSKIAKYVPTDTTNYKEVTGITVNIKVVHTLSATQLAGNEGEERHAFRCSACNKDFNEAFCSGGTATCSEKAVCSVCKGHYGALDSNNHKFTNYVAANDATCKTNGHETAACDYGCDETNTREIADSALGHDYVASYAWAADGSACTLKLTCQREGCTAQTGGHVKTHECTITHDVKTTATCKEKGTTTYTAAYGNYSDTKDIQDIAIDPANHDFAAEFTVDVAPTCAIQGSKSRHCTRCDEKTEVTEIAKTDHTWDAGKVTKEATETAEGEKIYTCTVCGEIKTEVIPKKEAAAPEQPKKGDVVADDKTSAKVEIADATKKEVEYKAPANKKAKTVSIPATVKIDGETYKVTQISDNAFKGNKTVTKVTIGNNIKTIGKNAFSGATKLKKVTIGKNVKEIEANAFKGCSSLTSITLPSNVTKIGANAFSGCKKLKTITIKSTKLTSKTVAKNAFKGLTKETTIKVPKKKLEAYKKLFKSKGLSSEVEVKGY